jgi:hypothetical protein
MCTTLQNKVSCIVVVAPTVLLGFQKALTPQVALLDILFAWANLNYEQECDDIP